MSTQAVTLVNIGNTHTQYATARDGVIGKICRCHSAGLPAEMFPEGTPLAVASVVPDAVQRLAPHCPFLITNRIRSGVDWSKADTSTLGADRIANAIGLRHYFALPAVCIDLGTAITFEVLDKQGRFLGGSIAPGRMLLRRALHSYTAQLPLLEMDDKFPAEGIGGNTIDALRCGIDGGAIGMVKGLMDRIENYFGGRVNFVAVGGDRTFFLRNLAGLSDGGEDFTLRGILIAWELNHEN